MRKFRDKARRQILSRNMNFWLAYEAPSIILHSVIWLKRRKLSLAKFQQELVQINNLQSMEEFYRRKYLSPTYTRVSSYNESRSRERVLAELRKQKQLCLDIQTKFDELQVQIRKLQRQNTKLQKVNSSIEAEYLQKIRKNKVQIHQLKADISRGNQKLDANCSNLEVMEKETQALLEELRRIHCNNQKLQREVQAQQARIQEQHTTIQQFEETIRSLKLKKDHLQAQNCHKQNQLEKDFDALKSSQQTLQDQVVAQEKLKIELASLVERRKQLQNAHLVNEGKAQYMRCQLEVQEAMTQSAKVKYMRETDQAKQKMVDSDIAQEIIEKLESTKEKSSRLLNLQHILQESGRACQSDSSYLEKVQARERELRRMNDKLQECSRQSGLLVSEEQQAYSRIIGHMKQSIIQDQRAIQSLHKQAELLQDITR